jgi:MFS family permease
VRALASPNFRRYFFANAVSTLGMWAQQVALAWLAYRITGSASMLGLVAFLARSPQLFAGPFAGVMIDRFERRRMMIAVQLGLAAQAGLLALLTATGEIKPWHLIVLALAYGLLESIDVPLRQSLTPQLLNDRASISNAIALNATMFHSTRFLGPPIAGALLNVTSEAWCFLANGLTYLLMAVVLASLQVAPVQQAASNMVSALKEGFDYARQHMPIWAVLASVAALNVTAAGFVVLLPVFAKDIFHGRADTLGLLLGAAGAGALASAVLIATMKQSENLVRLLPIAWVSGVIGMAGLALPAHFAVALGSVFVAGFAVTLHNVAANALIQTLVPDALRGRLVAIFYALRLGLDSFGGLVAGLVATALGAPPTLAIQAAALAILALWLATLYSRLRNGVAAEYRLQS